MNKLFFGLIIVCVLSACGGSKVMRSSVPPAEVKDIQLFEPLSYASIIASKNEAVFDDSLSELSKAALKSVALAEQNILHIGNMINFFNLPNAARIEDEINWAINTASKDKSVEKITIPPTLDSILEANGKRFGMIIISTGFVRSKANYRQQNTKNTLVGLATLGGYMRSSYKSALNLHVMILDAQQNNASFFNQLTATERSPNNKKSLTIALTKLFEGYFYAASPNRFD